MMEVTPHLKCVLKNYQHSATKSLQGPGLSLAAPKHEIPSPELSKEEEFVPAPFPVQQVPILTIPDKSCSERSETILEGETISCFVVGGEKRLCLPQVLNSVLRDFTLMQINQECDHLQIYCSRCTPEQLNVLKDHGILPSSAPSCGLITKTDAERLCSALLHGQNITPLRPRKTAFSFGVYHECFGKCKGVCFPELFTSKNAKCIECKECQGGFSPQQFVCHVHRYLENRTVHWGFDSCNWRCYLYVCKDQVDEEQCVKYLDDMQQQYEGKMPFPQPQIDVGMKRKQVLANLSEDFLKTESLKKQKLAEYMPLNYNSLPNSLPLQQIYASIEPVYNQYFQDFGNVSINRHISAFKPVPQIIKESKIRHALSINRYSDPPILQNPERVILMSDSERFERSFQPNVALAPPTPKKHRYGKVNETLPVKDIISPVIKTEHIKTENDVSSNHLNGPTTVIKQEEVIRKTPEATKVVEAAVSVVQRTNSPRYNPEIELSTDTEDSASETSEKLTDVAKLEEVLKPLDAILRGRILEFFKTVTREHERLIQENNTKDNKIIELELRNTELMKEIEEIRSTCHKNRNGGSEIVNNHHNNNNNDIDNNCESDEISSNNNESNVDNLVTDCSSSDKTNNISSDKNVEENDQQHQYSKQNQQHSVIASLAELEKGPVVKIEPE